MNGNTITDVGDPTSAGHAANKRYADEVRNSALSSPASFKWLYQPGDGNLLGNNRFVLYDAFLRLGPEPHNKNYGTFHDMMDSDSGPIDAQTYGSIWQYNSTQHIWTPKRFFKVRHYRFGYGRSGEIKHMEFKLAYNEMQSHGSLGTGSQYYISIGGLF